MNLGPRYRRKQVIKGAQKRVEHSRNTIYRGGDISTVKQAVVKLNRKKITKF